MKMVSRRLQDVSRGHFSHARSISVVVITLQRIYDEVSQCGCDRCRRLVANREHTVEIVPGERQFLLRNPVTSDSLDFGEDLAQGRSGYLALDCRRNHKWTGPTTPVIVRRRTVGISVLLPQVHVDPRAEQATKHCVHHHRWKKIWMLSWQPQVADPKLRLRCIRLVDDVDRPTVCSRRSDQSATWANSLRPPAKCLRNEIARQQRSNCTGDYHGRRTTPVVAPEKGVDVASGQARHTFRRPIVRFCISRRGRVEKL